MLLEKIHSRSADGQDQVGPMIAEKSTKVINEWPFWSRRLGTGNRERSLIEVYGLTPLPIQFGAEVLSVFAPGSEIATEGMN
jgi:hypothetical protein